MVSTLGVIFGIENAGDDSTPLATQMRNAKTAKRANAVAVEYAGAPVGVKHAKRILALATCIIIS